MKLTKKQLKLIRGYWTKAMIEVDYFYKRIDNIELQMRADKELKIKDIMFYWSDNGIVGIGNESRSMKLLQEGELK
jgi:hypothetical protein